MKERVVFQINVPVTAALAYADGLKVEGRYGDQVMYSPNDERVMYVPPAVRDRPIELGIRQREPFSICKAERREGSRRFIEWVGCAMTDYVQCETLGEVLSPSQVHTYLTCPAKWFFRYLLGLSEPATGSLALGRAFHQTLATNFRQKMSSRCDLTVAEIREVFAEAWATNWVDAEFREDEDRSELMATGEALVTIYMANAARSIEPQAVELPVGGEITGVQVCAFISSWCKTCRIP